jgi:hypothetical protein
VSKLYSRLTRGTHTQPILDLFITLAQPVSPSVQPHLHAHGGRPERWPTGRTIYCLGDLTSPNDENAG